MVIQHIRESEEVARVKENILLFELVGGMWELVFSGVGIHGGGCHNDLDYRKQSKRVIGISLVVRYQPYFF